LIFILVLFIKDHQLTKIPFTCPERRTFVPAKIINLYRRESLLKDLINKKAEERQIAP
jgi:hypothetical protein